ncbi:hypothetical protein J010_04946 [Cryptococcus neoformans]|nr:hypothetical protein J010_04946 [Cryptococcus neoformans var. grubii]OXH26920.1 hypothetical protein J009_04968 [Cryptococcus neoformans var. grubii]OXH46662.1 hypothetical protein J004_05023 [Cryptococcus neoformans var. grubii]OXH50199.1 hypothetical protein J002_04939 [Cryptococcus neoformans var. grubii]OXH66431.1 hypothetical protein J001_04991 [Cryptococcus neoformans var. grubii]
MISPTSMGSVSSSSALLKENPSHPSHRPPSSSSPALVPAPNLKRDKNAPSPPTPPPRLSPPAPRLPLPNTTRPSPPTLPCSTASKSSPRRSSRRYWSPLDSLSLLRHLVSVRLPAYRCLQG